MRFDAGSTNLTLAGTAQIVNNVPEQVTFVKLRARAANVGNLYIGVSDVTSTNGWELEPRDVLLIDLDPDGKGSSLPANTFYFNGTTTNDDIDWVYSFK